MSFVFAVKIYFIGRNPAMAAEWSKTLIKQIHIAEKLLGPRFKSRLGLTCHFWK